MVERIVPDNVGRLDAGVRWLLALGVLAGTALLLALAPVDWAPTILLGGFVVAAYLMLTAYVGFDALYVMWDVDTLRRGRRFRGPERPPGGARVVRARPRD